jgi:hypothetical protein
MSTDKCPMCADRRVETLDHHLNQGDFPSLAVCPYNLVPTCWPCNDRKGTITPETLEEHLLHPYYDDIEEDEWLDAQVLEDDPPALFYFINPPMQWNSDLAVKVGYHFDFFKLASLYASNAADVLGGRRGQFEKLFDRGGPGDVRAFCQESYESLRQVSENSWEAVLYRSLARSDWFCNGGCVY